MSDPIPVPTGSPLFSQISRKPDRLLSIDVFRAVTMFFMIFVNDVDGVRNIPEWIKHVDANTDGLGFADTIFPAFLFIVGLSLPFAINRRISNGDNFYKLAWYILTRAIALLVMGFFHVNLENYNHAALLPRAVWEISITAAFFLIWLDYPEDMTRYRRTILQVSGLVLLLVMAYLYKGGENGNTVGLKPYWWGILGIIGWSYLVCAVIFLLFKGKLLAQAAFLIIFYIINTGFHSGAFRFRIPVIGEASSVSLTMAGVVASLLYTRLANKAGNRVTGIFFTAAAIILIVVGLLIRPYTGGISKIHATTAWISICTGISLLVFELMIYLVDLKRKQQWFKGIRPAGTSTLTCYLIPYFLYSVYSLTGFRFPQFFNQGAGGIVRSFVVSFFVIWLTGRMEKRRVRLKI